MLGNIQEVLRGQNGKNTLYICMGFSNNKKILKYNKM